MSRHGSMNRVYRLIWSYAQCAWVVVGELAQGRGKSKLRKLIMPVLALSAGTALAGPEGGQVVSGAGVMSQQGATTTINQSSQNLSLNWQRFNVGSNETVNFVQPSASAIAVNRILDTNGSQILGHLNANGQVWLINPNGILFGQGAQVNVGGLVASTLDLQDATLNGDARWFGGESGDNGNGSVINRGNITAANGGYVALLGNYVSNEGSISATNGTVALGAGSAATLTFSNNSLVALQVDVGVLNSTANNGGVIHADGGVVVMTAGAKDQLLASVVNNTGVIEAHTVENHDGKIVLLGGNAAGTVNVAGTLDASAPNGGNGGFIETSAAQVKVARTAKITTAASMGLAGTWLIDPVDFTIAASGGDITGAALSASLGSSNVVIHSVDGASGTLGDVNVNDVVSWSSNKLTLSAYDDININANLNASGSASLAFEYGQGAVEAGNSSNIITNNAAVNLPAGTTNFTTKLGSDGSVKAYTVITSLGAAGSTTTTDLQGMYGDFAGNYALGADIDAAATAGWNSGAGFASIGDLSTQFTGTFDGLGHTVSDLTINRPTTNFVGLFGYSASGATVRNVGLLDVGIAGHDYVAGLVARNDGTISNSRVTGSVTGNAYRSGGLVAINRGTVSNSHSAVNVAGSDEVGGLVGYNHGTVTASDATGNVSGNSYVGGLVGRNESGTISDSYATTGTVNGTAHVGGLAGANGFGHISNSHASTSVTSTGNEVGGLVGFDYGWIDNSYATGSVNMSGSGTAGGLIGVCNYCTINNNYATGNVTVTGGGSLGGLVGYVSYGEINNSYASGLVSAGGSAVAGGLIANSTSSMVTNSYWDVTSTGQTISAEGTGLTTAEMQSTSNLVGFHFTDAPGASGNNWVMVDADGNLNNIGGAAGSVRPMLASEYSTSIGNAHQLQLVAMDLAGSYTLAQNIDAAATGGVRNVWGNSGFVPLGINTPGFTGSFDGQGHTISGLVINRGNFTGLFGRATGSVIENVGLVGGSISGSDRVGALVGQNYGLVNNSYATGTVTGSNNVGGLIGGNYGTVTNSYATANVSGTSFVGGLAGSNSATITDSFASTGSVNGTSNNVGGLAGSNYGSYSQISNSYASTSVTGIYNVGGLVGYGYGSIDNSYATGSVSGSYTVGGLVGYSTYRAVNNSYASGLVSGSSDVGGLIGLNSGDATTNSYWDITSTGQVASSRGGTGLTTAEMQSKSNFVGFIFTTTQGATGNNWVMVSTDSTLNSGNSATRPMLASEYSTTISNAHQLQLMIMDLSANYTLTQNIDAAATATTSDVWISGTFAPIGKNDARFTGTLDGVGHTIDNLHISLPGAGEPGLGMRTDADEAGLFGHIGAAGNVQNVGLVGGSVVARDFIGAIAGQNDGTITNSYASVTTQGRAYMGGLVGYNTSTGTVTDSHATGSVTASNGAVGGLVGINEGVFSNNYATGAVQAGEHLVGGLVGLNRASISNSYATGSVSVSASNYVGGLVGRNYGDVSNSYATGAVDGQNYVGGLLGGNYGAVSNTYASGSVQGAGGVGGLIGSNYGPVTNSFWDTQASGQASSSGGLGLTSSQMMQLSSFSSWNTTPNTIANTGGSGAVWRLYEGLSAPLLTQYLTALTLTDASAVLDYNGTAHSVIGTVPSDVITTTKTNAGTYGAFYSGQQGYDISGGGTLTINKADLTVSTSDVIKTYDGTLAATGVATVTSGTLYTNVSNSNTLDNISGGTFAFTNANAGSGNRIVITTGVTVSDGNSGGNYNVSYTNNTTSTIDKAGLTISTSDVTKTYDRTLTATGAATITSGELYTNVSNSNTLDSVSGGAFAFTNANAGSGNKNVTTSDVTISDGNGGGNYDVTYADNTTSTINRADLTIASSNVSKIYDGGLSAAGNAVVTNGVLFGGDSLNGGSFAFTDKNIGDGNKTVTTSAVNVSDGDGGGNYNVSYANNTSSTITPAQLTVTGITANDKTYDGTTAATLSGLATVAAFGNDIVAVSGAGTGMFADANVGVDKPVTVSGFTLSGADANNYVISQPPGLDADIAEAVVIVTPEQPTTPIPPVIPVQPTIPIPPTFSVPPAQVKIATGQIVASAFFPSANPPISSSSANDIAPAAESSPESKASPRADASATYIGMNGKNGKPLLQIVSGGMKLPDEMADANE